MSIQVIYIFSFIQIMESYKLLYKNIWRIQITVQEYFNENTFYSENMNYESICKKYVKGEITVFE